MKKRLPLSVLITMLTRMPLMMAIWVLISVATPMVMAKDLPMKGLPIATFFNQLQTFSADFSQTVTQEEKVVQQSSGKVWLKKPLKFRWNYDKPDKMQLISDGKRFYHYDIELAQVTSKPVQEIANSAMITLLNNQKKLDEVFQIKPYSISVIKKRFAKWIGKATSFYQLVPKNPAKQNDDMQASLIILGFNNKQQLTIFYTKDAFGENSFYFHNIQQNHPIANKTFRFDPPKGVDILGE